MNTRALHQGLQYRQARRSTSASCCQCRRSTFSPRCSSPSRARRTPISAIQSISLGPTRTPLMHSSSYLGSLIDSGASAVTVGFGVVEFNGCKDRVVIRHIKTSDWEGDVVWLVCFEGRGDGEFVGRIAVQNVDELLFLDCSCGALN